MILDLYRQGLSVSAIARRAGLDRKTVRKYVDRGLEPPVYGPRESRTMLLDPFSRYLRERVAAFPELSGRRIFEENRLVASHPVLEGSGQRRVAGGHRRPSQSASNTAPGGDAVLSARPGETVARRPLAFYAAVAQRLAEEGVGP